MKSTGRKRTRSDLLALLARVGREHSDATVLFHSTMAGRMGLHPTDYKVLGILERVGALTAGELARSSGLATASVTDLIDRLEGKGFVRRVRDETDRRRILVQPAIDRLAAGKQHFDSARRSLARLYDDYSERELGVIADFLARNAERLRTETEKAAHAVSHPTKATD